MYEEGQGTAKNPSEAMKLYKKAAAEGNAEAGYRTGVLYETGKGVSKIATAEWYSRLRKCSLIQPCTGWGFFTKREWST
ncbi:hypothetical protein [Aminivibrio sp.]|uniref:hypothetical protein n=1 Tax=Aminivibrio sp. TaxID=1872489 RepID=UPI00345EA00A